MSDLWSNPSRSHKVASRVLQILVFLVLAAFAVASQQGSPSPIHSLSGGYLPLTLLVVAAAIAHRHIRAASALAALSGVIQLAWVPSFIPAGDVFYVYVFHALGSSSSRGWRRFGLISAVSACVLPTVIFYPQLWPIRDDPLNQAIIRGLFLLLACGVISLGGWSVGYMRWQSRAAVEANVAARLARVERARLQREAEDANLRERIATEMHDVVAHSWAVVAAQADGARYALRASPADAERALDTIGDTARAAITDLRRILHELRYQESDSAAADAAHIDRMLERVRDTGRPMSATISGHYPGANPVSLTIERILGEALTNALKHGDPRQPITVDLRWADESRLRVTNALCRPTGGAEAIGTGHGVLGMRQRAAVIGATISIGPEKHEWVVDIRVPPASTKEPL